MRFLGFSFSIRLIFHKLWFFVVVRLPSVALFETTKLFHFLGIRSLSWINKLQRFLRRFKYGPLVNRSTILLLTPDGAQLYCPISDIMGQFSVVDEIYLDQGYDRYFEPKRGFIVIDAGAHVGIYTVKAAKKVGKTGLIISIEPSPYTYRLLITNLRMNNLLRNVIPMNIALADFRGSARFYLSSYSPKTDSLRADIYSSSFSNKRWVSVPVDTIDSVMEKLGLERCDLLKVDVEGSEMEVLQGAANTLEKTSSVVVASYHFAGEEAIVKSFLESKGFREVFSFKSATFWNVYAIR